MSIYLVRHGQTKANVNKKYCGITDSSLTDNGIKQINLVGELLKTKKIDKIYSSPLIRTVESSQIISQIINKEICINKDLSEINFGIYEGLTWSEATKIYPKETKIWSKKGLEYTFPKGESFIDVKNRVKNFFINHNESDIAIISHAGTIKGALAYLYNMTLMDAWKIKVSNGSVILITKENKEPIFLL